MAISEPHPSELPAPLDAGNRLDSWKEIASYLRRGVRTVKRWEKEEGLPVHRHLHRRLGSVYAFKAELDDWLRTRGERLPPDDPTPALPFVAPTRRIRLLAVVAAIALLLIVAGLFAVQFNRRNTIPPAGGSRLMLAVLPFENLSGDPGQEFFSDGLTEEIITELGQIRPEQLGLIAHTSSRLYKGSRKSVSQIASELGVNYLLGGSVRRDGERVRVAAQLIRGRDQTHVWAQVYERQMGGIFEVQSDVVGAIAEQIRVALDPGWRSSRARLRTRDPGAHEAALRGRYFLDRRTSDDIQKALASFNRAIALDPSYALAYVGLADAHMLSTTYGDAPATVAMASAREAVLTALKLDDELPEAHAWLGIILSEYDWDWSGAERQFRRAVALNANYAYARKLHAEFLSYVGRFDEAIAEARLARQLDPVSIVTNTVVGLVLYRARQYDQALAELALAVDMDRNHPMPYLPMGLVYLMKGLNGDAVAALDKSLALTPGSSEMVAQLAHAHARAGRPDLARTALRDLRDRSSRQHVSPFSFALVHLGLGEPEVALEWLERAYDTRDWYLCVLKTEPILDPLRQHPRFQRLLQRMGFP